MNLNNITHSNIQNGRWSAQGAPHQAANSVQTRVLVTPTTVSKPYAALAERGQTITGTTRSALGGFIQSYKAGAENAVRARQAGMSISQGLNSMERTRRDDLFLQALSIAVSQLQARQAQPQAAGAEGQSAPQSGALPANGPSVRQIVDQLGSGAQGYLVDAERAEILGYLSQQMGVDLSNMSAGSALDSIIGMFSPSSSTGAAAGVTAGSAAAGTTGTASTASAATAAGAEGEAASAGSSIFGAVGAAYSAYQLIDSWGHNTPQAGAMQGAAVGGYVGSMIMPGIGTLIGAGIGAIAGGLIGMIRTGKHKDQIARDRVRDRWQQAGIIDGDYSLQLADGSKYNIGYDGGHNFKNVDGTKRRAYETDASNPLTPQVIGWAQPLAALLTGGDPKLRSDFTGYLVNAALSNSTDNLAGAAANLQAIYGKLNVSPEQVLSGLQQMAAQGAISERELNAYAAGFVALLKGEKQIEIKAPPPEANLKAAA